MIHRTVVALAALAAVIIGEARNANAAVVCARRRADGTFNAALKIREACRANESRIGIVALDPFVVGTQGASTTSTSAPSGTTMPGSTVTTTTFPGTPACGNGVVEGAEACDCQGTIQQCQPSPTNASPFNWNACPTTPAGRFQYCAADCSAWRSGARLRRRNLRPGGYLRLRVRHPGRSVHGRSALHPDRPCRCF